MTGPSGRIPNGVRFRRLTLCLGLKKPGTGSESSRPLAGFGEAVLVVGLDFAVDVQVGVGVGALG